MEGLIEGGSARHGALRTAAVAALGLLLAVAVWVGGLGAQMSTFRSDQITGRGGDRVAAGHRLGLTALPLRLQALASSTLGAADRRFTVTESAGGALAATGDGLSSSFDRLGPTVRIGDQALNVRVVGIGHGNDLTSVRAATPVASANRVVYARRSVSEWYRSGPLGLEQGFTVRRRPGTAAGWLTISERLARGWVARPARGGLTFASPATRRPVLRYDGLTAVDALGRSLPARLELRGRTVLVRVNDARARYPVRIDPIFQQSQKLTANDETGAGSFGYSVAVSGDGNTALVGGFSDNGYVGAAWVFTRSGSTWTQQGSKLVADDESGPGRFGSSVALSADGNTAVIGANYDNSSVGAAWVFTRSGSTWTQQGAKLTANDEIGPGYAGYSVALSSDGDTALIGGYDDNGGIGAAWVFSRSGSTWSQQGSKLTADDETGAAELGSGVALSGNGDTALVGGQFDNNEAGAAWIFTRSGSTWTQSGSKLTPSDATAASFFGLGVALSGDGRTALIGGSSDSNVSGAAWVFTLSGSSWIQQGPKLTANDEAGPGSFGYSVALSGDGNTALIGGFSDNNYVGAAWVFTRSGSAWTQQGQKLTVGNAGYTYFGLEVALSTDGATALIGGYGDANFLGAAWVYTAPSTLALIGPPDGSSTNNTEPTFSGTAGTASGDSGSVTVNLYAGASASGTPVQSVTAQVQSDGSYAVQASSSLADGTYTVQAQQSQSGSVVSSSASTFTVDTVAPGVSLSSPVDGSVMNVSQPTFSGMGATQSGDSGSVIVDVYAGSGVSGSPVQTLSATVGSDGSFSVQASASLADGQYTARSQQADAAGNVGSSSASTFTVDTTPPASVSNLAPANGSRVDNATPTLQWSASSDSGSGLAGYRVLIDGAQAGGDLPPDTTSLTPSAGLADGAHSWQVLAFDRVGNVQSGDTWSFIVDTTPPTAAITADVTDTVTGETITFDASASTDPGGAAITDYSWDPQGTGSFATSTGSNPTFQYAYTTPGTYHAAVQVTDSLGLTATASITIRIEPAPPPGNVGVLIDDGNYATNDPHVTVGLVWPAGAGQVLISNDGGFGASGSATTFPIAARVPWTLKQTGSDRLPKILYVRFVGLANVLYLIPYLTFTDDIVLDEQAPALISAKLVGHASKRRATASRARRTHRRYAIKLKARDTIVGLCAAQASNRRRGGQTVRIKSCHERGILHLDRTIHITTRHQPRYVRVKNSAGSWSHWHKLS